MTLRYRPVCRTAALARKSDLNHIPVDVLFYTRLIKVFSTDWAFGGGEYKCCRDDGSDSLRAEANSAQRLPSGLEQGDTSFALGAQAADELVAGGVVRVQVRGAARS